MMILPFSARLRDTLLTLTLTLLSGCALIQDEPAQVAIVNPQQAQLAQVIHLANSNWPAARMQQRSVPVFRRNPTAICIWVMPSRSA